MSRRRYSFMASKSGLMGLVTEAYGMSCQMEKTIFYVV